MRRLLPLCLLALAPVAAPAQERPARALPSMGRAPKVDGVARDCSGLTLKSAATEGASASFTARVGWRKDTLFVCVEAKDNTVVNEDAFSVSLFFPGAGPTATGHLWRFGANGKALPTDKASPTPTPEFALARVEAGAKKKGKTLGFEAAIPARAFPRFPAQEPLVVDVCVTYEDHDAEGPAEPVSNCSGGAMVGEALKLPDDFRKGLKLKAPEAVLALEAAPNGWLGWDLLYYPRWVEADEPLTVASLRDMLAAREPVDISKAGLDIPDSLEMKDGKTVITMVSGRNPYATPGECDSEKELRLGLFLVNGKMAQRALEWPAATCALGRAQAVGLDEEGALIIRYSNGATINFAWSGDHFERTELGNR